MVCVKYEGLKKNIALEILNLHMHVQYDNAVNP